MYVWKLWRDSRVRMLGSVGMGLLWVLGALYVHLRYLGPAEQPTTAWRTLGSDLSPALVVMGIMTALVLSEVFLGGDFVRGTAEVLLTRPRSRAYFAWTAWLFGTLELLGLMMLMVACAVGVLAFKTGAILNWRVLLEPILLLPCVSLVFGLGYLISVVTNGRNGGMLTFGILLIYLLGMGLLVTRWNVHLPKWWFGSLSDWATYGGASMNSSLFGPGNNVPFPLIPLLGWLTFTLVFPVLAQYSVRRKQL